MQWWRKEKTIVRPEPAVLAASVKLNNGVDIPRLGLGVYQSKPGSETQQAVEWALEWGYRHIDTAAAYRNETDVGNAIRASSIPRNQIFVTTKLYNTDQGYDKARAAFEASLERLGLDYVDLYLIHWPLPGLRLDSWRALERIHHDGRARAIGVSNYLVRHLGELLAVCEITPAVNQIELHPFIYRHRADTIALCSRHNIAIEAYSPLTKATRLKEPVLRRIAKAHDKSPAQVLIRYGLDHDTIVLPKSVNRRRIQENADVFCFRLSAEEIAELDTLNQALATGWDPSDVD